MPPRSASSTPTDPSAPVPATWQRRRLSLAAPLLLVLSLFTLTAITTVVQVRSRAMQRRITHELLPAHGLAEEIEVSLALEMAELYGFSLTGEDRFLDGYAHTFAEEAADFARLAELLPRLGPELGRALLRLDTAAHRWHGSVPPIGELRRTAASGGAAAHRIDLEERLYRQALAEANEAEAALGRAAEGQREHIDASERMDWYSTILLSVLALGSAAALLWLARRVRAIAVVSELRRQQIERLMGERMRLMRGLSHDLRNPLGAVSGYAQLLDGGHGGDLADEQRRMVRRIDSAVRMAISLLDGVLDVQRADAGRLEIEPVPTDLLALLEDATSDHRHQAESAELDFQCRLPAALPPLTTDPVRLRRVVDNLLSNAIKYTPHGGRVVLAAALRRDGDSPGPGSWVAISVEDTGRGIPEAERQRVFEEFYRNADAARRTAGAGIGLAISRDIARALGGELTLASQPGEGTTFTLWLPAPAEEPEPRRDTPLHPPQPRESPMKKLVVLLAAAAALFAPRAVRAQAPSAQDIARWERQAANVTITRDDWGIAHVRGKTDADAVFGMEYAQAEDDFNRVETNYINAIGRLAEAEGESAIWRDLRMKLFIDPDSMKAMYAASPEWLKTFMVAFADGLNYYLYTHPEVKPRVITRFEPWMALTFSEGSIGGDIERVDLRELEAFYGGTQATGASGASSPDEEAPREPTGSNGFAIAPKNTLDGHALLFINPHTSHYFRSELHMTSDEGLNAYGAVTWGQFFIYQGFNPTAGWMHTSSGVDNIDEFLETVVKKGGRTYYRYGTKELPMRTRTITVPYRTPEGMKQRTFTAYYTQHGPIVRAVGDRWVSVALMQDPVDALTQSYGRTKAKNMAEFEKFMELHTNSSNNTIFADAEGNIAYFHSNYIPRRDTSFDWTAPVDGSNPKTAYHGVLSIDETPNAINPAVGWVYNSNNWPWSAAGPDSPRREDYPAYVERGREETPRGHHALKVLPARDDYTMLSLTAMAFDNWLPAFETMVPPLLRAWDAAPASSPLKAKLAKPIEVLRDWDRRWGVNSVATSLAVFWGTDMQRKLGRDARAAGTSLERYVANGAAPEKLLESLAAAVDRLTADFGTWQTPWGDINRFQRLTDDIEPHFDDGKPSIAVPFTSAAWGSLASFGARPYPNTKKWYGTSGNSFVAVVEFGDSIRARAVTAGGESGDPASPHFNDEAVRYANGNLRVVYFYPSQLAGHTEREYHPGK